MTGPSAAPVTVVGAGPYGLATAAHLSARGVPVRILGEPMDSWRTRMPVGMFLKSTPRASTISDPTGAFSLDRFRAAEGRVSGGDQHPVPLDEFVRYGLWFNEQCVPEVERTAVRRIDTWGDQFRISLESGEEFTSDSVVLATGLSPYAHVPPNLAALAGDGLVSHPADHADLGRFAGQRVAVVGAGQSALESAALLREAGAVPTIVARTDQLLFGTPPTTDLPADEPWTVRVVKPPSPLGPGWSLRAFSGIPAAYRYLPVDVRAHLLRTVLGPAGAWWLRARVQGRVDVLTGRSVRSAQRASSGARLVLADRSGGTEVLDADHVLAATGYRVDVDRIGLLAPGLRGMVRRTGTAPRLSAGFESSVPGLYFTGLSAAATFGPLLRFVCGTGFAAGRISSAVAARR
ncbi:FAD-dependent oxidoreductase [Streptacidiphilus sp. PB12-B1b]|uniref:FAD-dependent oxidoreductase n=1 Tax=Streptacidiphilus sp. PB12-B1b TaxID=2705012 RepID=UPI001CDBBE9B|nr:FAD-dependent oxidoreductase [Streptacidiphilus sp. PB12-B1b]